MRPDCVEVAPPTFNDDLEVIPGWTVQPDFQYIWHPNGVAGRDAKVTGVRTILKF